MEKEQRITVKTNSGLKFINIEDILFCRSLGNYTEVNLSREKHLSSKTLKEVQGILPKDKFVRIHQSYLVNIAFITGYDKVKGIVFGIDNTELPVSKRLKPNFINVMSQCSL
jgi:two-component system, LytTR family, response regulator